MLKNYIKIAFRNLFKQKVYSFINIFGLAVGIACCILIGLYVYQQWNFDTFHANSGRIYRAWEQETRSDGSKNLNTATPVPLAAAMKANIPEVEAVTYLKDTNKLIRIPGKADALNEKILVVNSDFYHMFDFKLLKGSQAQVFDNPHSIVLSQKAARQFFGNENPLQKTLSIRLENDFIDFTVTGVIENPPANSSLSYNMLIPDANLKQLIDKRGRTSWFNIYGSTYVMFKKGTKVSALKPKLAAMMKNVLGDEEYNRTQFTIGLQPLTDIHLDTKFPAQLASVSDPAYFYILSAIALLILLIACVNFMTLSISRSASRAKEVGIRKTIGAIRGHLMYQFWGEALIMTLLALILGIAFAELLLPFFNELSGTTLTVHFSGQTILVMIASAVLVSLIAGIYPALILSGFRPVEVLKGKMNVSGNRNFLRKAMVVFQFTLSIALIIGTLTIRKQLNYVQTKDLGYQKNQVVVLESGISGGVNTSLSDLFEDGLQQKNILKSKLAAIPEVKEFTVSSYTPVQMVGWYNVGFKDDQNERRNFHANIVDADFLPTMGIKVTMGRNFSDDNPSDQRRAIIVNQAMADYFGWKNPIGQHLPGSKFKDHEVIGLVENFNYESLHTSVEPLAMAMSPEVLFSGINTMNVGNSPNPRYSLKLSTGNLPETMNRIKRAWQEVAPGTPFDYTFVDQALDSQYRDEQKLGKMVTAGSVLAIIIACLGLFGLASLTVAQRTKEIGVRKVLGASSGGLVILVNRDFTKLVAVAFVLSVPISWYAMHLWLRDFAYRVDISVGIFLLAGALTFLFAWLAVGYQSFRATNVNPVESLRNE